MVKQFAQAGLVALAALAGPALPACAVEYQLGHMIIERPWGALPPSDTSQPAYAFFTMTNLGDVEDVLVSAATTAADSAELLRDTDHGSGRRFVPVEHGIAVPSGGTVVLAPDGLHICIMGLDAALAEGDSFPMTLHFEAAGTIEVDVVLGGPDPSNPEE